MQIAWWLFPGIHETPRMRADCSYMSHAGAGGMGKALTVKRSMGTGGVGEDRSGADTAGSQTSRLSWPFGASSAQPTL